MDRAWRAARERHELVVHDRSGPTAEPLKKTGTAAIRP
jgi:hypothetical protein